MADLKGNTPRRVELLRNLERKLGLPRGSLWGVYGAETDFGRNLSTSSAGAQGPFQFMPSTASGMGVNPHKFSSAAKGAARYLSQYKDRGLAGMLAAYNAGPAGNPNNPQTQAYIPKVQAYAKGAPYALGSAGGAPQPARSRSGPDPVAQRAANIANAPIVSRTTEFTPSRTIVDKRAAIVDALLSNDPGSAASGRLSLDGGLASAIRERLASGAYSTVTPESTRVSTVKERAAVRAAQSLGGAQPAKGRAYPTAVRGQIIGTPHAGTHTLGNWQSDNAVDIGVPNGTGIQSVGNGVVEKVSGGYSGGSSRFDGYQITVRLNNGNRVFYTHLSRAGVKPGQRISNGQQIGLSGSANGVPHLHLGVERGDPRALVESGPTPSSSRGARPGGQINVADGANRSGGHLTKFTGDVVRRVAAAYGKPLTIGTATNHNRMTSSGNVSDHWDGHGADIPMSGAELTRLGKAALKAFGQPDSNGGIHTFNWKGKRLQIIFNADDHWDHLHVGARPA